MLQLEKTYMKRTKLPVNGSDPFYYHIFSTSLPPEQAYRIIHPKKDQKTLDIAHFKQKGYKKRAIYLGYSNWTELEKEWIVKVKDELRKNHKIDLDVIKPFGLRAPNSSVIEGTNPIVSGRDPLWKDYMLLKYIVAYKFDMV